MLEIITASGLPQIISITVNLSAEEAVRTAEITVVPVGETVPVSPGQETVISAGADVLLTGYVRDVRPSHTATERTLVVTVCSRTVDATECSVEHPTGEVI